MSSTLKYLQASGLFTKGERLLSPEAVRAFLLDGTKGGERSASSGKCSPWIGAIDLYLVCSKCAVTIPGSKIRGGHML